MVSYKKQDLLHDAYKAGVLQFGEFQLKAHEANLHLPPSPVLFNLRTPDNPNPGTLNDSLVQGISVELVRHLNDFNLFDHHLAGVPHAGDPIAKALYEQYPSHVKEGPGSKQLLTFVKKENAGCRNIGSFNVGSSEPGDSIFLVDTVLSSGQSLREATLQVEVADRTVSGIIVVIDREQGGLTYLRDLGYNVSALFTATEILDCYQSSGLITDDQRATVQNYILNNPLR